MGFDPDNEAKRFNQKASRIQRAIQLIPTARGLEVLPFCALLEARYPTNLPRVQDMMGGTGYLAGYLQEISQNVLVVDVSIGMLEPAGLNNLSVFKTAGRFSEAELAHYPGPDVITSLAGLHHVFHKDGAEVSQDSSRALRHDIIARWLDWISPTGVMILADVPVYAQNLPTGLHLKERKEARIRIPNLLFPSLDSVLSELEMPVPQSPTDKWVLQDLPNKLMERFKHLRGVTSGPSEFFDRFVASHSEVGHDACFLSPEEFVSAFPSWNVNIGYLPTPWVFPDSSAASWYVKEKFAIGERTSHPDEMSQSEGSQIGHALEEFLGLERLPSGKVIFGWGLMFLVLTRKDRTI
jgi:SAM-dependent methyltransferase